MGKNKNLFIFILVFLLAISCSSDQEITQADASSELVTQAKDYLTGEIVLNTQATMNGVNKTLLPEGCPTKFKFEWTGDQSFEVSLLSFTVGKMGMIINFKCNVKTMQLNTYEKQDYPGNGWIKFYGEDGSTWGTDEEGKASEAKGSSVKGYYNVNTHQINFIVDYNMMNVRSETLLQVIDKSLLPHYDELKAEYERKLAEYKKEHGIS